MEQGKYYDRLCVRTVWPSGIKRQWWPVLGPLHDDREILRFYQKHYHVDHRFLKLREKQESGDGIAVSPAFSTAIIRVWPDVPGYPGQGVDLDDLPDPSYPPQSYLRVMRRRLSSQYPTYPGTDRVPWLVPLHEAHAESELIAGPEGAICPHRGTLLAGLQADPEGCVTCPLHGLRWNLRTGRLQPSQQVHDLTMILAARSSEQAAEQAERDAAKRTEGAR